MYAIRSYYVTGGRHIRYEKETPMTNLLVSMLDKAGVPLYKYLGGDNTKALSYNFV